MAFRRKKVTFKRKYKTRTKRATVAKSIRKLQVAVRRISPELKYVDEAILINPTYNSASAYSFLAPINLGNGQSERVGCKINPISISGRGSVQYNPAYPGDNQSLRVILFRARNDNGVIFQGASSTGNPTGVLMNTNIGTQSAMHAQYNWNNRRQFRILYDKTYNFTVGGVQARTFNWHFRLKGQTTYIEDDLSSIKNNGIYMVLMSDVAGDGPIFRWDMRCTYTDA